METLKIDWDKQSSGFYASDCGKYRISLARLDDMVKYSVWRLESVIDVNRWGNECVVGRWIHHKACNDLEEAKAYVEFLES